MLYKHMSGLYNVVMKTTLCNPVMVLSQIQNDVGRCFREEEREKYERIYFKLLLYSGFNQRAF